MKKLLSLLLISILLLSACSAEDEGLPPRDRDRDRNPVQSEPEPADSTTPPPPATTTPPTTTPPPVTTAPPDVRAWEEDLADYIISAFIEKNTEFLSNVFLEYSEKAFDFIRELEFSEFNLVSGNFDDELYEWVFFLNIAVENGTDDIFTLGGREWELRLGSGPATSMRLFAPKNAEIITPPNFSDYAKMCNHFSNDLFVFDTITDFNSIRVKFDVYEEEHGEYSFLTYNKNIGIALEGILRLQGDETHIWSLTADEFMERAAYTFGITNIDRDKLQKFLDSNWAHGWYWHYPALVSEEITDTGAEIILNFYGDAGYVFVAKTMKYTLSFGEQGVKFVAVECVYSDDDLIMASGAV